MTWGGDGFISIPDATTWDGVATGREWESHGASMELWTGAGNFHLYRSFHNGTVWSSFAEITPMKMESFNIKHGVNNWWQGTRAGTATVLIDYTDQTGPSDFGRATKIRITVDVPAGEKHLFTGFVIDSAKIFDVGSYPKLQVQLIDHLGWTSQSPSVVTPPGSFQTGNILVDMLNKAAAGFTVGVDAAGINVAQGLTQNYGLLTSGSLIDKINQYLRGELGMLYVDNSGIFQFAQRNWWNPLGDPIATVGSLDRGNTTAVWLDPTLTEGTYSFPEALVRTWGPVTYTSWTQTFSGGGPATQGNSTVAVGVRQWTDTVENTVAGDVTANLSTLSAVLYNLPLFRGHFDASATVRFGVEYSAASMNYAAIAKPTDFIELSKEALVSLGYRQWVPGHVMSVQHTWDSMQGWWCTLNLDLGLAEADHEAGG